MVWHHRTLLDDFFFAGPVGMGRCKMMLSSFAGLALELGVPLAEIKMEVPVQCLTFLGIEMESVAVTFCLLADELNDLREHLRHLQGKNRLCSGS